MRNTPQFPEKHGIINYVIEDDKVYINENLHIAGDNKLWYGTLDTDERATLLQLLHEFNFNKSVVRITENEYDAKYAYDININYNNDKCSVTIFNDSIPKQYEPLISFFEDINQISRFEEIKSKIAGIDDANIISPINDDNPPQFENVFRLWKYLMLYNGDIDTLGSEEKEINKEHNYSFSYGLNYSGEKLDKLIISENKIVLAYATGPVSAINKPDF